jgi:hypothetical protein
MMSLLKSYSRSMISLTADTLTVSFHVERKRSSSASNLKWNSDSLTHGNKYSLCVDSLHYLHNGHSCTLFIIISLSLYFRLVLTETVIIQWNINDTENWKMCKLTVVLVLKISVVQLLCVV